MHLAQRSHLWGFDRADQSNVGYLKKEEVGVMLEECPPIPCELEAGEILVFSTMLFRAHHLPPPSPRPPASPSLRHHL